MRLYLEKNKKYIQHNYYIKSLQNAAIILCPIKWLKSALACMWIEICK